MRRIKELVCIDDARRKPAWNKDPVGMAILSHLKGRQTQITSGRPGYCQRQVSITRASLAQSPFVYNAAPLAPRLKAIDLPNPAPSSGEVAAMLPALVNDVFAGCNQRIASSIVLLDKDTPLSQSVLAKLPDNSELRGLLQLCDELVLIQQRTQNPDSLLTRRLLSVHRKMLSLFAPDSEDHRNIQLIYQERGKVPRQLLKHDVDSLHRLMTIFKFLLRLSHALRIGSARSLLHYQLTNSLKLQLAEAELAIALDPHASLSDFEQTMRQEIRRESQRKGEEVLLMRIACGYSLMPRRTDDEPLIAVHPRGAVAFASKRGHAFDIDLTLLTKDPTAYPHPDLEPQRLSPRWWVDGWKYIDLKRRPREIVYDWKAAAPVLKG